MFVRDINDTSLAIEFMAWAWNGKGWLFFLHEHVVTESADSHEGLSAYVKKNGFGDPVLSNCAIAIELRYEHAFDAHKYQFHLYGHFVRFARHFISEMWASARALEPHRVDELTANDKKRYLWIKILKLFLMSQRRVSF